jgi:hypothetical protein
MPNEMTGYLIDMIMGMRVGIGPCKALKTDILIYLFPVNAERRFAPFGALIVAGIAQAWEETQRLVIHFSIYRFDKTGSSFCTQLSVES